MDVVAKGKIPCPCRESNAGRPARNLVAMLTELPGFHVSLYSRLTLSKMCLFYNKWT